MYDTKTTDYKITSPDCPFSTHKYANIAKEMFDAFRAEGLAVSAYFSKPDWHNDAYWHKEFGTSPTRNVNYDIDKHPELWEEFVQFTHKQLTEITSDYGKIDVIWLDGGWVSPTSHKQDIRLGEVVEKIRSTTQPHLICCDRTIGGAYENIVTPEQSIPPEPMDIPWESCITLGRSFSFHYDDDLKSPQELIHSFIDIVSKGGSLALNITPQPDGALPTKGVNLLRQLGGWLQKNGEGIYFTHISKCKSGGNVCYTAKDGKDFAFYRYLAVPVLHPYIYLDITRPVTSVKLLRTGESIPFSYEAKNGKLVLDTSKVSLVGAEYADCFEISY